MNAGDIGLLSFPFTPREPQPFKKRPVLVLGDAPTSATSDASILVAMITSSSARVSNPGRYDVPLEMSEVSGLTVASVCRSNRLWTAEPADFVKVLGQVTASELSSVKALVKEMFSL